MFLLIAFCTLITCEAGLYVHSTHMDRVECRAAQVALYEASQRATMCVRDIDNKQWRDWE